MPERLQEIYGRLVEELKTITYKPGWSFKLLSPKDRARFGDPFGDDFFGDDFLCELIITATVHDAYRPDRMIEVTSREVIDLRIVNMMVPPSNGSIFASIVHHAITKLEMHEVNEFFRVNGKHFIDPHPELKRTLA